MIIIHFSLSETLTAEDLQDYMDSAFGREEEWVKNIRPLIYVKNVEQRLFLDLELMGLDVVANGWWNNEGDSNFQQFLSSIC